MNTRSITYRILETPAEMEAVEEIQRQVWPGSETGIVPAHMLIAATHGGGIVIGAYDGEQIIGMVYGFPGFYITPDGPRLKHCSHMLGIHPDYRDRGIGFALKRAQWQMVRRQGIDRITWTFDPLKGRNAFLNIVKLGAVCNTYIPDCYGHMDDEDHLMLPSDRFEVDWWVNSQRVNLRLSKRPRRRLVLDDYQKTEAVFIQPFATIPHAPGPLALVEIPSDFESTKAAGPALALEWRLYTRAIFEALFQQGYLVTDFVHQDGSAQSFYVLSHGEATL
jgi:predicted GNAT superfamily acetyltransferase